MFGGTTGLGCLNDLLIVELQRNFVVSMTNNCVTGDSYTVHVLYLYYE